MIVVHPQFSLSPHWGAPEPQIQLLLFFCGASTSPHFISLKITVLIFHMNECHCARQIRALDGNKLYQSFLVQHHL